MAYTFMDDYGNEWMITTANPSYKHHRLISFVEIDESHHVTNGICQFVLDEKNSYTCYNTLNVGLVWSELMLKSEEATEGSVFWQWEILDMEMEDKLLVMLEEVKSKDERYDVYDKWYGLRDAAFVDFYRKHPEHPDAAAFIADINESKEEANA